MVKLRNSPEDKRKLFVFNLGLLFFRRARRILEAHGYSIKFGNPKAETDMVAVWGRKKTSLRGRRVAQARKIPLLTVEDSFLRSVRTGRQGAPSLGIISDNKGIYFDTSNVNDLHDLILSSAGISPAELDKSREGIEAIKSHHLSKYNAFQLDDFDLPYDYVLVVDQTVGDASIDLGGADRSDFKKMLECAIAENPGVKILIKSHPETTAGKRAGHFGSGDLAENVEIYDKAISPWRLMQSARAVYCVTSQMGLEAIFAGHKPVVFGAPFYAGWGLSDDRSDSMKQKAWRLPEHLFWAAYQQYSLWYDPFFKRASTFYRTVDTLTAQAVNWRDTSNGAILYGMRLWKRGFLTQMFKQANRKIRFAKTPEAALSMAKTHEAPIMVWGQKAGAKLVDQSRVQGIDLITMEDGFIRSKGLGAALVRPCSLVLDKRGIYYDPTNESDLERLIARSLTLPPREIERAKVLRKQFCRAALSKYNLGGKSIKFRTANNQEVILVVGQVEDDASVMLGGSDIRSNTDLLWAARQAFPKAYIIYKPHPDVEAGLRTGAVKPEVIRATVDKLAPKSDIIDLIKRCDKVCTITSLTGFEALLHGKDVVCFGAPFYAGWGLTDDRRATPDRRLARPNLDQLVHACLISYPRYWDPVSGEPCAVETVFERFEAGEFGPQGSRQTKMLAKLQGVFSSFAHLWR